MILNDVQIVSSFEKTCTCKLKIASQVPSGLTRNGVVFTSVLSGTRSHFFACTVYTHDKSLSTISIPNFLLKKLSLKSNDLITLSVVDPNTVPVLSSVSLDATPFDLDALRSNEAQLEQDFLRQCSFVYLGMQVPVWCGSQLVYCTVTNFHPISIETKCGRLAVHTTLHLDCCQAERHSLRGGRAVALSNGAGQETALTAASTPSNAIVAEHQPVAGPAWIPKALLALADFVCRWLLGYGLGLGDLIRLRAASAGWTARLRAADRGGAGFEPPLLLQVRPIRDVKDVRIAEPNCGLVNARHLGQLTAWSIVQLTPLGPRDATVAEDSSDSAGTTPPPPQLIKLTPCNSVPPGCLRLTPEGAAAAGLGCGVWVRASRPPEPVTAALESGECLRLRELRIRGAERPDATKQILEQFLRERTAEENPVLIVHNRRLAFTDTEGTHHACAATELAGKQRTAAPSALFTLLCREMLPRLRVSVDSVSAAPESTTSSTDDKKAIDDSKAGSEADERSLPDWLAGALDPTVAEFERSFDSAVCERQFSYLALLRATEDGGGGGQSGKTALLRRLAARLRLRGYRADILDCRRLERMEFASARRRVWSAAALAAARSPACLCLDNLEAVCAPVEDALVGTAAEVQQVRMCHLVRSLLKWTRHQQAPLMLVATCGGPLHPQLMDSATGQCLFDTDCRLDLSLAPTEDMRRLLASSGDPATRTGGRLAPGEYARCLQILAYCRSGDGDSPPLPDWVEVAPASLRRSRGECDPMAARLPLEYPQIRGLDAAKAVLERAIAWPLRYPRLVRRIRGGGPGASASGVLLTGPSGCGKSLLARALSRHLRMRLLAVRGPELLNKFVGASERAVRDLFAKARRLRPCLIFLDEVDALAPRRGNDTTGVTDRVVNQLLTELDGLDADALDGVAVLAATNRPDLVDPALLRPGRIGLRAACPAPGREERRLILASLLAGPPGVCDETDSRMLDQLAEATAGYCSADFNALLLQAAAAASTDGGDGAFGPAELLAALPSVRPSLGNAGEAAPATVRPGQRVMFA